MINSREAHLCQQHVYPRTLQELAATQGWAGAEPAG